MFQIVTVIIVLGIFSLFAFYAHKAEKFVAEKARIQRGTQGNAVKTAKVKH